MPPTATHSTCAAASSSVGPIFFIFIPGPWAQSFRPLLSFVPIMVGNQLSAMLTVFSKPAYNTLLYLMRNRCTTKAIDNSCLGGFGRVHHLFNRLHDCGDFFAVRLRFRSLVLHLEMRPLLLRTVVVHAYCNLTKKYTCGSSMVRTYIGESFVGVFDAFHRAFQRVYDRAHCVGTGHRLVRCHRFLLDQRR